MQQTQKKAKPRVARMMMPDGTVRNAGLTAAAKWLGVSLPTMRRIIKRPHDNEHSAELNARVRAEFPEFFTAGGVNAGAGTGLEVAE